MFFRSCYSDNENTTVPEIHSATSHTGLLLKVYTIILELRCYVYNTVSINLNLESGANS